jgi:hypothetical protein
MSAAKTKVFGMDLGIDPKILALLLVIVAIGIYYFTSGNSDSPGNSSGSTAPSASVPTIARPVNPVLARRAAGVRRANALRNKSDTLKFVAVDGSRGDVDPTLRLGLLERVRAVQAAADSRNLFDSAGTVVAQNLPPIPKNVPKLPPGPLPGTAPPAATTPPVAAFNIPLKYYGFVKPTAHSQDGSRGFFMDGDNILVGSEGDVLEKRFLIVALTPNSARLEDTQIKQGQELQVTPAATPSQ